MIFVIIILIYKFKVLFINNMPYRGRSMIPYRKRILEWGTFSMKILAGEVPEISRGGQADLVKATLRVHFRY